MVVMALPIFTGSDAGKSAGDSVADRTEYYTTAKNLLTSGADAMERLMTAYKVTTLQSQFSTIFYNHTF
jgi:ATP-binding cassette subfamily D (ALD) protein 2